MIKLYNLLKLSGVTLLEQAAPATRFGTRRSSIDIKLIFV